jgi:hypothetical protein
LRRQKKNSVKTWVIGAGYAETIRRDGANALTDHKTAYAVLITTATKLCAKIKTKERSQLYKNGVDKNMKKTLERIRLAIVPTRKEKIMQLIEAEWINSICCAQDCRMDGDVDGYNAELIQIAKIEKLRQVAEKALPC